jgi:Raf kinase inhibitor-like YbhB/YbcL family protein
MTTTCAAIAGLLVALASDAVAAAGDLRITSPSFEQNAVMPPGPTCDGNGASPALQFHGVPPAAKSLVLIVVDPDVPRAIKSDGRYLHRALWDLPPDAATIAEGGGRDTRSRGLNENGRGTYIAACPPNGEHRYVFQLFALDTTLGDARISSEADLRRGMEGHVLEQAELVGRYTTRAFRVIRIVLVLIGAIVAGMAVRFVVLRQRAARQPN